MGCRFELDAKLEGLISINEFSDIERATKGMIKKNQEEGMVVVDHNNNGLINKTLFYTVKLPGIYILITFGIMVDFIIHLPFLVICAIENLFHRRTG